MAISIEKKAIGLVLGLLGAFALYAALAPAAKATEVTTPNSALPTTVTIESTSDTDFIPTNAYNDDGVKCQEDADGNPASKAEFTIRSDGSPPDNNKNQPDVGDHSGQHAQGNGHGSVTVSMNQNPDHPDNAQAPVFRNCDAWDYVNDQSKGIDANVDTNDTNGAWSVSAHASNDRGAMIAIGVPMDGVVITFQNPGDCTITVPDGMASAVMGEYHNPPAGDNGNGMADVDEQVHFRDDGGASCSGDSPAQFEAIYEPEQEDVDVSQ